MRSVVSIVPELNDVDTSLRPASFEDAGTGIAFFTDPQAIKTAIRGTDSISANPLMRLLVVTITSFSYFL
jgi:hypothetical protein